MSMLPSATSRLAFRQLEVDRDLDFVAAMMGDVEVMRHFPQPFSREEALAWIDRQNARYERDGHGLWLIVDRTTSEPIGQVGLMEQFIGTDWHAEIGYLIHRTHWRRGYATEAAIAVRDHAFGELAKASVISLIRPSNFPSQGVAVKLGMTAIGMIRLHDQEQLLFRAERRDAEDAEDAEGAEEAEGAGWCSRSREKT